MANPEIDKLMNTNEWNMNDRVQILKKIDEIATNEYHWAFNGAHLMDIDV